MIAIICALLLGFPFPDSLKQDVHPDTTWSIAESYHSSGISPLSSGYYLSAAFAKENKTIILDGSNDYVEVMYDVGFKNGGFHWGYAPTGGYVLNTPYVGGYLRFGYRGLNNLFWLGLSAGQVGEKIEMPGYAFVYNSFSYSKASVSISLTFMDVEGASRILPGFKQSYKLNEKFSIVHSVAYDYVLTSVDESSFQFLLGLTWSR